MNQKPIPSYVDEVETLLNLVLEDPLVAQVSIATVTDVLKLSGVDVEKMMLGSAVKHSAVMYRLVSLIARQSIETGMAAMISRLEGKDAAARFLDELDARDEATCTCDQCMEEMVYGTDQAD